jgi:ABC-type multidrug transport system fused ATPase/permease subunit
VRLLVLTHRLPYAPNRGDRIRAFHLLKLLAPLHEVHLVSLVHDDEERAQVPGMEQFLASARGAPVRVEDVVRAAETIGAHEFILRLAGGYETQLQERGTRLSLGQRQLVALARALLADPRILILDEATSSVDIGTERKIEQALRTLLAGRTAFVIAHRLSTIRDADLIVVLEHGQIVEQGTHDELLRRQGLYTSLYGDWAADVA